MKQLVLIFLLCNAVSVRAQVPSRLTNDHPIVIGQLISFYDSLTVLIAARNSADPDLASSRQLGARNLFGLTADGYNRMGTILSGAKARLDAVQRNQAQYVASLTPNTPGASVDAKLQDFYQQQTTILTGVPAALRAQLTSEDWTGLQAFIANELVAKIHVGVISNATK